MYRIVTILTCIAFLSACIGSPPRLTRTEVVTVSFEESLLPRMVSVRDRAAVEMRNGDGYSINRAFVQGRFLCNFQGCLEIDRIARVSLPESRLDAGNIPAVAILGAGGLLVAPIAYGFGAEYRNQDNQSWLERRTEFLSYLDAPHQICGDETGLPPFEGRTDAEAASWVWEYRALLSADCLREAGQLIWASERSDRDKTEYRALANLRRSWLGARCNRVHVGGETASPPGFADLFDLSSPALALIGDTEAAREQNYQIYDNMRQQSWPFEVDGDLENRCRNSGGVADRALWPERLELLRSVGLERSRTVTLVRGEDLITVPDTICSRQSQRFRTRSERQACWIDLFEGETDAPPIKKLKAT